MIDRTQHFGFFKDVVSMTGFGWIYGLHGIGKTTFAQQLIALMTPEGVDCIYIDLREEKGIYPDLASCINEHVFGKSPQEKSKDNLRILRDLSKEKAERHVCLFLDELDVYSESEIEDVRHLAETFFFRKDRSLSLVFLSARSKSFFEADDPSSTRHTPFFIRLEAFERDTTIEYLQKIGYEQMIASRIADLSGGNPELLKILTSEIDTNEPFIFDQIYGKQLSDKLNSYFRTLWSGLDPEQQGIVIIVATMFSSLALNNKSDHPTFTVNDITMAATMLNGLHQFGDFHRSTSFADSVCKGKLPFNPPVSPLFQSWILINHGGHLTPEKFSTELHKPLAKGAKIFGMDIESWKNLSTSISVVAGFEKLAERLLN